MNIFNDAHMAGDDKNSSNNNCELPVQLMCRLTLRYYLSTKIAMAAILFMI